MNIHVYCFTNIDDMQKETWPNRFACRPERGDTVHSYSGKVLKIVGIQHAMEGPEEPYLRIELHYLTTAHDI